MVTLVDPKFMFKYDGVAINIYHANKGEGLPKHSHAYSHATFCTAGSCIVRTEKSGDFVVDKNHQPLDLSAGNWHEIEALEDNTIFINVFAEGKY